MRTTKRLTASGGITIPKDMRLKLGWKHGTVLDIEEAGGGLVIAPHVKRCTLCGGRDRVHPFHGALVCEDCAIKIKEEIL